jgi:hypothetical protein
VTERLTVVASGILAMDGLAGLGFIQALGNATVEIVEHEYRCIRT